MFSCLSAQLTVHLNFMSYYAFFCDFINYFVSTPFSVSIKAPTILGAQKINSTSFSVSWDPVPSGGLSALIVGYRLSYYNANDHNSSLAITYTLTKLTNSSQYAAILSGLQVYSNYCVQVRAFTNVEEGPASECFFLDVKNGKTSPALTPDL